MSYNFVPTAQDSDGDQLTFKITNKPAWASFDTPPARCQAARMRQCRQLLQYHDQRQ
jgi:large repetitive protein